MSTTSISVKYPPPISGDQMSRKSHVSRSYRVELINIKEPGFLAYRENEVNTLCNFTFFFSLFFLFKEFGKIKNCVIIHCINFQNEPFYSTSAS
ncbi:hypothetical protein V1477_014934 [Vespula maculifrons]|uniref:Uncharacterized protein n=1 Tax=Vespula maculifrons TaxID=7453 RepID=A0ABD2BJZ3_VESMC